ncbi:hypothetical protein [Paraburkholderia phenoliruptrix]|uniref:hypothetical protein n=1 Tax=Paraburkholderia phenoliruptrix TaxID=252970 RepID=UPI003D974D3A
MAIVPFLLNKESREFPAATRGITIAGFMRFGAPCAASMDALHHYETIPSVHRD